MQKVLMLLTLAACLAMATPARADTFECESSAGCTGTLYDSTGTHIITVANGGIVRPGAGASFVTGTGSWQYTP